MAGLIEIHPELHQEILQQAKEINLNLCFTCLTCQGGCPINQATGRLQPLKIVRMARYGLVDELFTLPELWYCLRCNNCVQGCPMTVKPSTLITHLRWEMRRRGLISDEILQELAQLDVGYQRARWHLASRLLKGQLDAPTQEQWRKWKETPAAAHAELLTDFPQSRDRQGRPGLADAGASACFTCGECTAACPVTYEPELYDPRSLFRMTNLDQEEELLSNPSIWLCLTCERCTKACCQKVSGHLVMQNLQNIAIQRGLADAEFAQTWKQAQAKLYPFYLDDIDVILIKAGIIKQAAA